ncbi:kynurenine 3-monooxygenase-like isoform X4 [Ostrea edulis]|uniref:kynurenine 3-monooxygenase-like isoform X4 n=1 Tax=Ostrea edulis TaxID=37623 RepID=UPI0024AECC3B|nr:kynurenine 3-monooxygenase-like isoform X4 [Ostrea edulis]
MYIMSVDRRRLNEVLLSAAEASPDVTCHFEHKLATCNFTTGELEFINNEGKRVKNKVDLIVGNDGAFSAVRKEMMKATLLDFQQEYIPHGYMELTIPPSPKDEFQMEVNYLHIWPRNEFMMIALPNLDKSFTCTLFMPFDVFASIKTKEDLMNFFKDKFPDSIPLIGENALKQVYLSSKPLPMVSIKCSPYNVKDKGVIMGDAAHAMVPFYGQGMNAGFEDCIVLNEMLDKYNNDFSKALPAYSEYRKVDDHAICDLAMYNYIEMRESVNSRLFIMRKKLDNLLFSIFPNTWIPLYTMVAFSRIRYHQCIARRKHQDENDMDIHSSSQNDMDIHSLSQNDMDIHSSSQNDVDIHSLSQNDVDIHSSSQNDVDIHSLSQNDVDIHSLSQNDVDIHSSSQNDMDIHSSSQNDMDIHSLDFAMVLTKILQFGGVFLFSAITVSAMQIFYQKGPSIHSLKDSAIELWGHIFNTGNTTYS